MIKVGIIGCKDLCALELVRLLLNHPDVELKWVAEPGAKGMPLDHIVPGIVGESDLTVVAEGELRDIDLLFLCGSRAMVSSRLKSLELPPELRVIDLSGSHNQRHGVDMPWTYGLSEMQRRVLVHDAQFVTVPGNVAAASLLALLPMARNLLLNSPIELHAAIGVSALDEEGKTIEGLPLDAWVQDQQQELALALSLCQSSFNQPVRLTVTPLAERRTLAVAVKFKCGVDSEMARQLYDQYYDDHNFVFMVDRPLVTADVENTNKCLIHLEKDDTSGMMIIHAVMDVLLKGCAGTAVHVMNLMYGLHERVGLALKGTGC